MSSEAEVAEIDEKNFKNVDESKERKYSATDW